MDGYTTYNLNISNNLLNILKDYIYEVEHDLDTCNTVDEFIISAIVEKLNNLEEKIFSGEVDEDGFTDKRSFTEHFIE